MKKLNEILRELLDPGMVLLESTMDDATGHWAIIIDSEAGVTLDQTSQLARRLMKHAEIEERFPEGLQVEVSSPGIDYPLTQIYQFKKNIGRKLRMELNPKWDWLPKKVRLNDVQDNVLHVSDRQKKFQIPLDDVKEAHVLVSFH